MVMRVALTAGGTGGHIFPAISVYEALVRRGHTCPDDVRFFGPEDRGERAAVEKYGIQFVAVPAAAVRDRGPVGLVRSVARLAGGTLTAIRRLRAFQPDAVFSTGGYASFPGSVAARVLRRPLIVYLPDVSPGWAVRAEMRLATRMATTAEAALGFLPRSKTVVTGYPVREEFFSQTKGEARAALGIGPGARVLLVAGASLGSATLNSAVSSCLEDWLRQGIVVLHVTGREGLPRAEAMRAALPAGLRASYEPAAFRDDLPTAMVAADLAVMRAGASVLGELPAAALPAVLVPGLWAGAHQRDNARWLADNGAAVVVEEAELARLGELVSSLLRDRARLDEMAACARALARPAAADDIADLIAEVARR
jgi:UDP-N-acetylglucosamine--N-acetylmuramyl-(pentapeptide) pyrophosphoryl-undecaprenol N-acetylglucosamine transferase